MPPKPSHGKWRPILSPELAALCDAIPADFASPDADYRAVRAQFAPFHGHPVGDDLDLAIQQYGNVRCGDYRLPDGDDSAIAFHCHGGAFVSTPLDEYHFYAELIARETGLRVVMPDYRLAPENTYPAAHDDCYHAYLGLLESGANPARIAVLGESCGGSLGLALLMRLRDEGAPLPACFVSITGWFDLTVSGALPPGPDPFLDARWVRNRGREYTAGKVALNDPAVSPAHGEFRGLPPLYLQVGEHDTVRGGALTVATAAATAGVDVTLEHWPGCVHGWHGLVNAGIPEAAAAWRDIRAYIEHILNT
ncbi:MAG: alpha/beta hydrolase [Halioglobus sp.]|nr:alpha/beta hydrolase [Halioglobus sp.]